jgi:hypothetical protein
VSLLTGLLSGLVPALHASKATLSECLNGSAGGHATARGDRQRALQGTADRDLGAAGSGASEQQIGDIGASDEQYKANGSRYTTSAGNVSPSTDK